MNQEARSYEFRPVSPFSLPSACLPSFLCIASTAARVPVLLKQHEHIHPQTLKYWPRRRGPPSERKSASIRSTLFWRLEIKGGKLMTFKQGQKWDMSRDKLTSAQVKKNLYYIMTIIHWTDSNMNCPLGNVYCAEFGNQTVFLRLLLFSSPFGFVLVLWWG